MVTTMLVLTSSETDIKYGTWRSEVGPSIGLYFTVLSTTVFFVLSFSQSIESVKLLLLSHKGSIQGLASPTNNRCGFEFWNHGESFLGCGGTRWGGIE